MDSMLLVDIHIQGSLSCTHISVPIVGDGTSLDFTLLNNSNGSDSVIGTKEFLKWLMVLEMFQIEIYSSITTHLHHRPLAPQR